MIGTIITQDNELAVRVMDEQFGKLILLPDTESKPLINASHIASDVEGHIVKFFDVVPETNIKVNTWRFHIESFETD